MDDVSRKKPTPSRWGEAPWADLPHTPGDPKTVDGYMNRAHLVGSPPEHLGSHYSMDPGDMATLMPAARCAHCHCVTWKVNLIRGLSRVPNPEHAEGCPKPPGRFDRMEEARDE